MTKPKTTADVARETRKLLGLPDTEPPPARLAPRAIGYRRSVLDAFIRGCEVAA